MVLLTRLSKQVYRHSSEELLGMHLRLLMTLSYLRDHDGAPQQELAEALCMDANNVVLLLNELEDLGHIARRRDPHDRRRHLVELTATGGRALTRAERAQESIEDEVLKGLNADERATLWRLLTRALSGAEQDQRATGATGDGNAAERDGLAAARDQRDAYSATTASIST